jgi:hypothetical protein
MLLDIFTVNPQKSSYEASNQLINTLRYRISRISQAVSSKIILATRQPVRKNSKPIYATQPLTGIVL